jgi:hypothetical protein
MLARLSLVMETANKYTRLIKGIGFGLVCAVAVFVYSKMLSHKPSYQPGIFNAQVTNGYDDKSFLNVRRGMPEAELYSKLGKPLHLLPLGGEFLLIYTDRIDPKLHYSAREIVIKNGKVDRWYTDTVEPYGSPWR